MNWKLIIIGIAALILILSGYIHIEHAEIDGYISSIGSIASVFGIIVAIWQIRNLAERSEAIKQAVYETKKDINQFTSFTNLQSIATMIDEVEAYVRDHKIDSTLLKIKQINKELKEWGAYANKKGEYVDHVKNINLVLDKLMINITILSTNNDIGTIKWDVIIKHLEKIQSIIVNVLGEIKGDII